MYILNKSRHHSGISKTQMIGSGGRHCAHIHYNEYRRVLSREPVDRPCGRVTSIQDYHKNKQIENYGITLKADSVSNWNKDKFQRVKYIYGIGVELSLYSNK